MVAIPELDGAISPLVFGGRRVVKEMENTGEEQDHSKKSGYLDRNMTFSAKSITFGKESSQTHKFKKIGKQG